MSEESLLKFSHVSFSYEENEPVLNDINIEIKKGERIAFLGSNGAGKSTFFLHCNGVYRPNKGTVFYKGKALEYAKKELRALRKAVGIVFQEADQQIIAPTVDSEISFGPMNLKLERAEVERRVKEATEVMQLKGMERRPPHYLSGGEKKRVTIAGILAMEPELILFDEPSASLDAENTDRLETTLYHLADSGITVCISTHDIDLAYRFATRVIVFQKGCIIGEGTPEEIFEDEVLLQQAKLKAPILFTLSRKLLPIGVFARTTERFLTYMEQFQKNK